jgi:hypothetical protein
MTPAAIIRECQQQGIRLFPNGAKLRVVPAPGKPLSPELLDTIKTYKQAVLAALADENAREYVAERSAICEADGLPPCGIRPVFEYRLTDDPHQPLIMLGVVGETLAQATEGLRDRFGAARVLSVSVHAWFDPPVLQ